MLVRFDGSSVKEHLGVLARCTVDVDHEGSQAISAKHHVLFYDWESLVDIRLIRVLSLHKVYTKARNNK